MRQQAEEPTAPTSSARPASEAGEGAEAEISRAPTWDKHYGDEARVAPPMPVADECTHERCCFQFSDPAWRSVMCYYLRYRRSTEQIWLPLQGEGLLIEARYGSGIPCLTPVWKMSLEPNTRYTFQLRAFYSEDKRWGSWSTPFECCTKQDPARMAHIQQIFAEDDDTEMKRMTVHRDALLSEEALIELSDLTPQQWCSDILIHFEGEEGVDCGGVHNEWLSLLIQGPPYPNLQDRFKMSFTDL